MALPKIKHITFDVTIPSTGKKEKFRPFTVQEEKIFVLAGSSKDSKDILNSISQVIINCSLNDDFDVEKLALFDIEWIFVQLRANSVNNVIELSRKYDDVLYTGELNLSDVKVEKNPEHKNKVMINDDVGVLLRYPSIDMVNKLENLGSNEMSFAAINYCIDKVFDKDTVYSREDNFTDEELDTFVSELPSDALKNITDFFNTAPSIQASVVLESADKKEKKIVVLKGIDDFF